MAKKKETRESPDGVLITAAKTIGAAAGKIAAAAGVTASPKPKVSKLVKKKQSRLPRRLKKTTQKGGKGTQLANDVKATD
jgi:hypothetical protein